jgi:hypothetical protein
MVARRTTSLSGRVTLLFSYIFGPADTEERKEEEEEGQL